MTLLGVFSGSEKESIDVFFHPKSVAVFGASTNVKKSGSLLVLNLITHRFDGKIYPINPKGGTIHGLKLYKSLDEIEDRIDLAVVFVPNKFIPDILRQCIAKGVKGAIIEAAGFSEVGDLGKELTDEIIKITDNFKKMRVIGPNCTGITYLTGNGRGFFSSFVPMPRIRFGGVVIITQSGFLNGGFLLDNITRYPRMGFRAICAIGNKMDVNENDLLEYFIKDDQVKIIGLYIESFADVRRFIKLSNEAREKYNKKVVILRSGLSKRGAQAISSHTGALAENSRLIGAAIKQSHAIWAPDFRSFFKTLRTLVSLYNWNMMDNLRPKAAIITISGGAGAVISDWCARNDIEIPELSEGTYNNLKELFPKWMPPNKFSLIDIWPAVENAAGDYQSVILKTIKYTLEDDNISVIFMTAFYSEKTWEMDWKLIKPLLENYHKPILIWLFGEYQDVLKAEKIFEKLDIPIFFYERNMVEIFKSIL